MSKQSQLGNNIENGETMIEDFPCTLQVKNAVNGKLYVSNEAIYFHGFYSFDTTINSKDTKIKMFFSDLRAVVKYRHPKIVDPNSLFMKSDIADVEYVFNNFEDGRRDACYDIII